MAVHEVNDQVGVMETDQDLINYISSFHRCRGPFETTTAPGSSYESSDSESQDRYSQYPSIDIIYPLSSSFSSSFSSSYTVEYSIYSQSESYFHYSYYDYDRDGNLDFIKWKNCASGIHSDHILPVIIALSSSVLQYQSVVGS
ncbi:hypothetical protein HOLleu_08445 [Holothuria leucospilota]|uniref:Uncharacterized protein n=1 Tax=Holothuria leucospilota TaxID=206669 RepID=A0A9Q1HGC1_HOLLE|nr:hypothetical protein HOLleu_08445 [Holothuria leucospilota]